MPLIKVSLDSLVFCITRSKSLAEDVQKAYRNACQLRLTLSSPYNQADDHETLLKKVERDIDDAYELVGKCLLWLSMTKKDFMDADEQVSYGWAFEGVRRDGSFVDEPEKPKDTGEKPWYAGYEIKKTLKDPGYHKTWDENGNEIKKDYKKTSTKATIGELTASGGKVFNEYEDDIVSYESKDGKSAFEANYAFLETSVGYAAAFGMYVEDGKPVIGAHIGGSYSFAAARFSAQGKYGTDKFNVHGNAQAEFLKMTMAADAEFSTNGIKLAAEAGLYLVDASVSGGVTIAGVDVALEAALKVGVGVNFDFEIDRNGNVNFEIGAALGLGVDLKIEIDASGAIDAICDLGEAALDFGGEVLELAGDALNPFNVKTMHYPGGNFVGGFNGKHFARPEVTNHGGIGGRF